MSDTSDADRNQSELVRENTEPGFLHLEEVSAEPPTETQPTIDLEVISPAPLPSPSLERAGTVEHLAARRPLPELDASAPEIKLRLSRMRAACTRLVTGVRWEGLSIEEIAERMILLLDVGSVEQWKPILIPFLYEIDRGGALIPVWLHIIERGDPPDLPADVNPAETMLGRARRFAILMLGNYKMMGIAGPGQTSRLAERPRSEHDLAEVLGNLSTDPNTSLYATQALVQHATVPAILELIRALRFAKGWARVDVVLGCLQLKQEQFHHLLIAGGLDDAPSLESYLATPLYREIPLESYLTGGEGVNSRLGQQAALIFHRVLQDSMTSPDTGPLPLVFERHLPTVARALFAGAQREQTWQYVVALHRLSLLLGHYWGEISQGRLKDGHIIDPVYHCLPMMNDVEHWMQSPGRDILLKALANAPEEELMLVIKTLRDVHDPRAVPLLIARLDAISILKDRLHALMISSICDALGQLGQPGDRSAVTALQSLVERTIKIPRPGGNRRRDNLPINDPTVPASIVYAAAVRTCGQLGEKNTLDFVYPATMDFDPYVRNQALEAIKRLDPRGEDERSRSVTRAALDDPRELIVRNAVLLIGQYHDLEAISHLQWLGELRPGLADLAQDTLRQLGQFTNA
jgi:hypothetical protein